MDARAEFFAVKFLISHLGVETVLADEGTHATEFSLLGLHHVVLVNYRPGKPRGAQGKVKVLGEVCENRAKPGLGVSHLRIL